MNSAPLRYFLFPHMAISEASYRHLSFLAPHLSILQVLRLPVFPEWGRERFSVWPTITEHDQAEQIKLYLKGYRDFANIHGEDSVLASMSHDWIEKEVRESRFAIQEELRGKSAPPPELGEKLLTEAAVFMEMAMDLDEKQMDLEVNYRRVEGLEEDFREILGITDEADFEDAIETLSPPLAPDQSHLSFMLRRRIAFWLRLFHHRPPEGELPVLVALSNEVLEELIDPLKTECDRAGKPLDVERLHLASIPALHHLSPEAFETLAHDARSSGLIEAYWSSLENVLREPHSSSSRAELDAKSTELEQLLEARAGSKDTGDSIRTRVDLTLLCTEGCAQGDFWRCIDKPGHTEWKDSSPLVPTQAILLALG